MKPIQVDDFVYRNTCEVRSSNYPSTGRTVTLRQHAGSMDFQFSMTPKQARELAAALNQHADHIEQADPTPSPLRYAA